MEKIFHSNDLRILYAFSLKKIFFVTLNVCLLYIHVDTSKGFLYLLNSEHSGVP